MARPEGPPQSGEFEQQANVGKENLGDKSQRERLITERQGYLILEALVDRFGIETARGMLDEMETRRDHGEKERKLVTVKEGAELKGVPMGTVHHWVRHGRLKVEKYELRLGAAGGPVFRELIDGEKLGQLAENRPRPGRPPKTNLLPPSEIPQL